MARSKKATEAENTTEATAGLVQQMEDAGLGPLRWMGTNWLEAMAGMNSEIVSFVADRIKEDVKTQHELLHCKSPEQLQKVQLEFLEKAYEQYSAETGKLIKMSIDMLPTQSASTKNTPI